MRTCILIAMAVSVVPPISGQSFQRHHITGGLGGASPRDDLGRYYDNAFSWTLGYGYRPVSFFQVDFGWDGAYNAARVNDFYESPGLGPVRIRDFQHFVPMGARAILPLADGKVQIYGGGGRAYMRYSEGLRQPSDFIRIDCPVCNARDGWGWYALAGADVAVTRGQFLRMGVTTKMYQGTTEGQSVGAIPPFKTNDRWVNVYFHLTLSL